MAMFKGQPKQNSPWSLNSMNMNLPPAPGIQTSQLPQIPQIAMTPPMSIPTPVGSNTGGNNPLLQELMKLYKAA